MTEEERIKMIEELNLKSDEMGLIPPYVDEIFSKVIHSSVDEAVNSLDKAEKREKLGECIRNSKDNVVILAKLLHDVIANCEDFHNREFLNDVYDEIAGDFLSFNGSELHYGSGVLEYIKSSIEQPLTELANKYLPYLKVFEEELQGFEQRWKDKEDSEEVDYDEEAWEDRYNDLNVCINDIDGFCEAVKEHFDVVDYLDNDNKISDSCDKIDEYLDNNFDKVITIKAADFERLVDAIAQTVAFKNASDYVRKSAFTEVIKYASKHNVKSTNKEKILPDLPEIATEVDLEEIQEDVTSRQR